MFVWGSSRTAKIANEDFSEITPKRWRKYCKVVLENQPFGKKQEGLLLQQQSITDFRSHGSWVVNNPPQRKWSVYVVELDLTRLTRREKATVHKCNPQANPLLPGLYVGQTEWTPEKRLMQHRDKARTKHGRKIFDKWPSVYGVKLRPDLYERYNQPRLSELESLDKEANLARVLRDQGYTVLGGH